MAAESLHPISKALRPLPEKWHGLQDVELRHRRRSLDLIASEDIRALFQTRGRMLSAIRHFMDARDFVEVETPVLQPTAGGAAARPFITHVYALEEERSLRIATDLYLKRLIVGGMDRVYEIGRIFRNEGLSTRHNPEFTMMESYEAYADYNEVAAMLETLVSSVAEEVLLATASRAETRKSTWAHRGAGQRFATSCDGTLDSTFWNSWTPTGSRTRCAKSASRSHLEQAGVNALMRFSQTASSRH